MKYIIAGLGNPGPTYENTRHNIGFKIVDALASTILFSQERFALRAELKYKGRQVILIKPQTFMNLSGKAIKYWLEKEKIDIENLLVITDDIMLPFGKIRLRPKGSHGGHNGLRNIEEELQTQNYPRLRFGIGNNFPKGKQVDYVLGQWSSEELNVLPEKIEKAKQCVLDFVFLGIDRAMNLHNS
jgi:PTH1 family peptidyl-tRNA hydrolase